MRPRNGPCFHEQQKTRSCAADFSQAFRVFLFSVQNTALWGCGSPFATFFGAAGMSIRSITGKHGRFGKILGVQRQVAVIVGVVQQRLAAKPLLQALLLLRKALPGRTADIQPAAFAFVMV